MLRKRQRPPAILRINRIPQFPIVVLTSTRHKLANGRARDSAAISISRQLIKLVRQSRKSGACKIDQALQSVRLNTATAIFQSFPCPPNRRTSGQQIEADHRAMLKKRGGQFATLVGRDRLKD